MPRSTTKSLAGGAVTAARKVIARKPKAAEGEENPAPAAPVKKAAATAKKATSTAKKAAAPAAKKATSTAKKASAPAKKASAAATSTAKKAAAPAAKKATSTAKKATTTAKKAAGTARKVAPRKSAPIKPEDLAVKEGEDAWTKAEVDEVVAELNSHAARLRQELQEQEQELAGIMKDAGDGAGHDQADMGATSYERDHELTVVNNSREMLAQTERALARIADGTYGVCESCGQPIGKMRVMAFPRATLCMECKKREERR